MPPVMASPRIRGLLLGAALGRALPHPPAKVPWIDSLDGVIDLLDARA